MASKQVGGARKDEKGRRVDHKGRLLNKGENQRKNLMYQYTYVNPMSTKKNKKEYLYSWRLLASDKMPAGKKYDLSLREKIAQLERDLFDKVCPRGGGLTVLELVEMYVKTKHKSRDTTKAGYQTCINFLKEEPFGSKRIDTINVAEAKLWLVSLQSEKKMSYSSIKCKRGVIKPAFQLAVESDLIRKNPFDFELAKLLIDDSVKRFALTADQERRYLNFLKNDNHYSQYYDAIFLMFQLGLRIGEFCGLRVSDLDFDKRLITIDHQLLYVGKKGAYIQPNTKTNAGVRRLRMSDEVYDCLKRIVANRPKLKVEPMINGYHGFLFIENNKPMVAYQWEKKFKYSIEKYNSIYKNELPKFTPHFARHTVCSKLIKRGLSVKTVQYMMGHVDIATTLQCYTHWYLEDVLDELERHEKAEKLLKELNGISGSKKKKELVKFLQSA